MSRRLVLFIMSIGVIGNAFQCLPNGRFISTGSLNLPPSASFAPTYKSHVSVLTAKKRKKGGRGKAKTDAFSNDEQQQQQQQVDHESTPLEYCSVELMPSSTRRIPISLVRHEKRQQLSPRHGSSSYYHYALDVPVFVSQVHDETWWETTINPYGGKCWPSSLAIAQFLAQLPASTMSGRTVVELGCGNGLVSIVAAQCGATVLATDISKVALLLTKQGWKETCTIKENSKSNDTICCSVPRGTLSTTNFDLTSSVPIPWQVQKITTDSHQDDALSILQPIVVAGAMMYEAKLAQALAGRIAEALSHGAWIIVSDDDTGQRENGRELFEKELSRVLDISKADLIWTRTEVKCEALGWKEKKVQVLHINPPLGILDLERTGEIRRE